MDILFALMWTGKREVFEVESLYGARKYPATIQQAIEAISPLAVEIANRWMLGWPETVKALLVSGEYLEALKRQEEQERDLFSRTDLRHLARHEICEMYGLSLVPPTPSESAG